MTRALACATVAGALATAGLIGPGPAGAAVTPPSWTVTAAWELNETAPATEMADTVGTHTGTIGSGVQTQALTPTGFGYRFGQAAAFDRSHLVTVPDSADLNPGNGGFAVTVVVKSGAGNQNITQKGQANIPGGYWKIDMNHGQAICLFRDGAGVTDALTSKQTLWDGQFHTIRCERSATVGAAGIKLYIDGVLSNKGPRNSGVISNTKLLSIGGKYYCDGVAVGCDYFNGYIDRESIEIS